MLKRRRWLTFAGLLTGAVLLAGVMGGRLEPARAAPPPVWFAYLPLVIRPYQTFLPFVNMTPRPPAFLGVNGGGIDGGAGTDASPGLLAYYPTLRGKSFQWLQTAGINWYRNYGSDAIVYSWRFTEPQDGQFDWTFWDTLVQQAQAHHINLLASIGNAVPQWANGSGDWRLPPTDLYGQPMENTAWYKFVYAFVQRYNGDGVADMPGLILPIKSWEFWNEPDLREGYNPPNYPPHQFAGTVTDLVRLRGVGYAAVKAADPTAVVVGPASAQTAGYPSQYVGDTHWFMWSWPEFVAAGGLNTLDVVSFTHYFSQGIWDVPGYDEPDYILDMVANGRGDKPVWFTESGWNGDPFGSSEFKARNLVRLTVTLWSTPWIDRFFWYDYQEQSLLSSSYHHGLIQTATGSAAIGTEPDPLFHPAYRAAELMQRVLQRFGNTDHPTLLNLDNTRVYHFSASGQEVWVAWARGESGTATVTIDTGGRPTRMIGLYGQDLGIFSGGQLTVGVDPVYLTTDLDWNPNVGRITGRLHDASQPQAFANGVVGAPVALTGPGNFSASAVSDSDGTYQFANLPDGVYHVVVPGYTTSPASYDVTVGREIYWGQTSFAVTLAR